MCAVAQGFSQESVPDTSKVWSMSLSQAQTINCWGPGIQTSQEVRTVPNNWKAGVKKAGFRSCGGWEGVCMGVWGPKADRMGVSVSHPGK